MVVEEILPNVSDLVSVLPPSVFNRVEGLVVLFKAVGVAFIVYVIYLLVSGIFSFRKMRKIGRIEKKVNSIDRKLNKLIKKKNK